MQQEETEYFDTRGEDWDKKKLEEVGEINLGQSPKSEFYNEKGEGLPFAQGSKNFGNKYPTFEKFCTNPKRTTERGDVLISVRAPVGPVNIAPKKMCIGRGVTALKMKEGPNEFLYYFLKYYQEKWSQIADGTTFKSITKSDLKNLEILFPPLSERERITEIFSNLDEKIENNKKINRLLEELAQTIFKSWFVDFEPYEEFKDSELGRIPKEFVVKNLVEVSNITYGYSFDSSKFNEKGDGVPVIRIRNLPDDKTNKYTDEEFDNKYWVHPGDVLVGMDGEFQSFIWKGVDSALNQRVCRFEGKNELVSKIYLYFVLKRPLMKFEKSKTGTTVKHLLKRDIDSIKIPFPDEDSLKRFSRVTRPIYNELITRIAENRKLIDLRDTLLPKLMSGEIRVTD